MDESYDMLKNSLEKYNNYEIDKNSNDYNQSSIDKAYKDLEGLKKILMYDLNEFPEKETTIKTQIAEVEKLENKFRPIISDKLLSIDNMSDETNMIDTSRDLDDSNNMLVFGDELEMANDSLEGGRRRRRSRRRKTRKSRRRKTRKSRRHKRRTRK